MDSRGHHAGFFSYVVTPYDKRGNVDIDTLRRYVVAVMDAGVDGITCIASTCEGPYLTFEERRLVATTVGKVVAGRASLNIGVGALSTRQAIEYAKHAQDCGATSLMLEMQQYFQISFEDAYRHFETIANEVPVPIRLYNLVEPTRFDFTPKRIANMVGIEGIRSIKEASGEVTRIREIRALCGDRFNLFCGFHYQCLEAFRLGAVGWEVMLHPLIAGACVELYRELKTDAWGAHAERLFRRLQPLFDFFRLNGVPQSVKALSEWSDLQLGIPRPPLPGLGQLQRARLKEMLGELGLVP